MMPSQRACGAEKQVGNKWSNEPLRAQSKAKRSAEYSATLQAGVEMPGICWYPAMRIGHSYESRWH